MRPVWIKWYPVQWLHSTARDEMKTAERATFHDFVCLAAISQIPGTFKFSSKAGLARMLNTEVGVVESTIKICIDRKRIALREDPEGWLMKILKWRLYQPLSPVDVKVENDESNVDGERPEHGPRKLISAISFSGTSLQWQGITDEDKAAWKKAYPACDIGQELLKMVEYLKSHPEKRYKNYRRFINSWLSRSQDRGGTKGLPFPEAKLTPTERIERLKRNA